MYFHKDVNTLTKWQMCTHRYLLNDSIHTYLQKDITRAFLYSTRSPSSHHRLTHTHTHTHTHPHPSPDENPPTPPPLSTLHLKEEQLWLGQGRHPSLIERKTHTHTHTLGQIKDKETEGGNGLSVS